MHELEELRRRIEGGESLLAITGAMKALAAVRIRSFREAARAVAVYEDTLESGLQIALHERPAGAGLSLPDDEGPTGAVVLGSDLGLAGPFNARIVEFAAERFGASDRDAPPDAKVEGPASGRIRVLAVGGRVAPHLESAGFAPEEVVKVPGSVDGIGATAQDVVVTLAGWREAGVERIRVYHQHSPTGAEYRPREIQLLPLDPEWLVELERRPWASRTLPMLRDRWEDLFTHLVRERLFIAVYRALADSLASEQASRLLAMETAEARVEEHLDDFRSAFSRRRQQAVTEELLELTAGYRALDRSREAR